MAMNWKKVLLATWLGMCVCSTNAFAQDMTDFRTRMADAAAMMKVDLDEALRQYLEIRVQYAGPEVDYSLGRAYQRLNQCQEAQHYYSQVMVAYNLPEDNVIYKRAVSAYDEIASCGEWQKVSVDCEIPVGGYVEIDGEKTASCWNRPSSFKDGEHTIVLYGADGEKVEKRFTAKSGDPQTKVSVGFPPKNVVVEKKIESVEAYEMRDRFNPGLYWGLIAGGAAVAVAGGFMAGYAGAAKTDERKYADLYALTPDTDAKKAEYAKKRDDANDRVKTGNIAMYALVGAGGAAVISGAVIAIINAVSDKERVDVSGDDAVSAFVSPLDGGVSLGFGMRF